MGPLAVARGAVGPLVSPGTYRAIAYLALAPFIGFASFLALAIGVPLGVGLSVVWVGIPLLLGLLAACRTVGAFDRRLANALLAADVEPPAALREATGTIWQRVLGLIRSATTWRAVTWMLLRFPLGLASAVAVVSVTALGAALIAAPFDGAIRNPSPGVVAAALAGGAAVVALAFHLVDLLALVQRSLAHALLGPSQRERTAMLTARAEQADLRADLARELHDSVGHSVTAAVVQAAAAQRVLDEDPAFVRQALAAIESQGREALEELDRVLAVLRDEHHGTTRSPTLDDLDALIGRTRAAGVALTATQSGNLGAVPERVSREAFRIIQEGLTNAMRHAHGAPVRLAVTVADGRLRVDLENGPGDALDPARSGGRGLAGVAQRLRPLGGSCTSGPTPDGGFALHAELPLGEDAGHA